MKKLMLSLVGAVCGAMALTAAQNAVGAFDGTFEQAKGWSLSPAMQIQKGEGFNGSGGLVWEQKKPSAKQDMAKRSIEVERGHSYVYSVKVRTRNFKSRLNGATICVQWYDDKGRWMAESHIKGVTAKNSDWRQIYGITKCIPREAKKVTVGLYITDGCSGKAWFDDVEIRPVERKPVEYVCSSAYRNVAVSGEIRVHALTYLPKGETDTTVRFSYENASGERVVQAAASVTEPTSQTDQCWATLALDVASFKLGKSEIVCEMVAKDGRVLGSARCPFERVTTLPKRRVYIDAQQRWVVDGRLFLPLGLYCGRLEGEQLEMYAKGPFNAVMPYQRTTIKDLDALQEKGIMAFVALRKELLDTDWSRANHITKQEQVDDFYRTEINKVKDHPAVLGWYVNDERPVSEVPARTHLQKAVFEVEDPNHPTWAVLCSPNTVREYLPAFDVVGLDSYPVGKEAKLTKLTDGVYRVLDGASGDVPMLNVPQTFSWAWFRRPHEAVGLRFPTEAEIANMNWQHIALGSNGLIAYNFHSLFRDCTNATERVEYWGRICRAFEPVQKLESVLLSDRSNLKIAGAPKYLPVRAWQKGGETYVLVVNACGEAQSATLTLGGAETRLGTPQIVGGSLEKLDVRGNALEVRAAPLAWAMIRFEK